MRPAKGTPRKEVKPVEKTPQANGLTPPPNTQRIMRRFEAAIRCKHGTRAPECAICRRENWLDCPVRTEPGEPPRTVGDVVKTFLGAGEIPSVEIAEQWWHEKNQRRRQTQKFIAAAGLTVLAGAAIAAGILIFEGGKLVLRLWPQKPKKENGPSEEK